MTYLFTNPLISIVLLLLIAAVITLCVMRIGALKRFLKQFVLLDDLSVPLGVEVGVSQGILEYGDGLELLQREIKKSERYNFPVSIILLEIVKNNSKKVDYLETLQATVKRSIRDTDIFAFLEQEDSNNNQFFCVLPHTKFNEAYELSERLRLKLLRSLSLTKSANVDLFDLRTTDLNVQEFAAIKDPNQNQVNISCGISELEYYEGIEVFLKRASEALEMAKIKGGSCTMPQPSIAEVSTQDVAKHLN